MRFKIVLAAVLGMLLVGGSFAMAQGAPQAQDGKPSVDDIISKMQSQLNLTADQASSAKSILTETMAKRQQLRESIHNGTGDRDQIRSQIKDINRDEEQRLGNVLTANQMQQWRVFRSEMRKQHMQNQTGTASQTNGTATPGAK